MRPRDRRRARALQEALERYDLMLASGMEPSEARRRAGASLGDDSLLLALASRATELRSAELDEGPSPEVTERIASRIRSARFPAEAPRTVRQGQTVRQGWRPALPRLTLAPAAVAACVAMAALVLVPALNSLPGDRLYSVKQASESARLWIATGPSEARVNVRLARERLDEVERLVERAGLTMGDLVPGLNASARATELDPVLAELLWQTFVRAGEHLKTAVDYYVASPAPPPVDELDDLVEVSQRGQKLASDVVNELPPPAKPKVMITATELAKIEADAAAVLERAEPEPTIPPCDTPTPEPTPTPEDGEATPTPDTEATATPEPTSSPEAEAEVEGSPAPTETPSPTPQPTPCYTPTPAPTPTPSPTPEPTPAPTPDETSGPAEDEDTGPQVA